MLFIIIYFNLSAVKLVLSQVLKFTEQPVTTVEWYLGSAYFWLYSFKNEVIRCDCRYISSCFLEFLKIDDNFAVLGFTLDSFTFPEGQFHTDKFIVGYFF